MLYSVVIPVYQAKDSLERCVASWLAQTYKEIEIILVDDGSTDGSAKICEKFNKQDSRVCVIHQKNAGVSAARNAGIEAARGEFLLFTDSDDYVASDYLEKMRNLQIETQSDLVLCGFHHLYDGADILKVPEKTAVFAMEAFAEEFLNLYEKSYLNMPWNKLFRREKLPRFDTSLSLGEDLLFNLEYLKSCKKVAILAEPLCYYIQEEDRNTLSSQKRSNRLELARKICEKTEKFYQNTWEKQPDARIFTRYMNEIFDECEKLPLNRALPYKEKIRTIRNYAKDDWVKERGEEAKLLFLDYRILWFFLKRDMPHMLYLLTILRRMAVVVVHQIRRKGRK